LNDGSVYQTFVRLAEIYDPSALPALPAGFANMLIADLAAVEQLDLASTGAA
jgi:hypothetical protein